MRYIQITEKPRGKNPGATYVQRYEPSEMSELFSVHELHWLSDGKIVERENSTYVDLQQWFERTSS